MRFCKLGTILALLALAAMSLSANVVGKWTGHFNARYTPSPNAKTQPKPEMVEGVNKLLAKLVIVLVIDAKGTYTAKTKAAGQPDQSSSGSWKLVGKTLTLTPKDKRAPEVGTLSKDGKSLTVNLPQQMIQEGISGKAVFKKG